MGPLYRTIAYFLRTELFTALQSSPAIAAFRGTEPQYLSTLHQFSNLVIFKLIIWVIGNNLVNSPLSFALTYAALVHSTQYYRLH